MLTTISKFKIYRMIQGEVKTNKQNQAICTRYCSPKYTWGTESGCNQTSMKTSSQAVTFLSPAPLRGVGVCLPPWKPWRPAPNQASLQASTFAPQLLHCQAVQHWIVVTQCRENVATSLLDWQETIQRKQYSLLQRRMVFFFLFFSGRKNSAWQIQSSRGKHPDKYMLTQVEELCWSELQNIPSWKGRTRIESNS